MVADMSNLVKKRGIIFDFCAWRTPSPRPRRNTADTAAGSITISCTARRTGRNSSYLRAWISIPPQQPGCLSAFLGWITRNLSLDWYKRSTAQKRGGGQASLSLDERKESVPVPGSVERAADDFALTKALNHFRASLTPQARTIFMRRYQNCTTADYLREEYAALLARDDVQINMHGEDYGRRAIRSSSTAAPGTREAYFMPYYRFYVEIPAAEKDGGMKMYGAYYVPAMEQTYIAEMPVWDGCFN